MEYDVTHSWMWPMSLNFEYLYQDVNCIGLLKDIQQCDIHAQMLYAFKKSNKMFRLDKFACSQSAYSGTTEANAFRRQG